MNTSNLHLIHLRLLQKAYFSISKNHLHRYNWLTIEIPSTVLPLSQKAVNARIFKKERMLRHPVAAKGTDQDSTDCGKVEHTTNDLRTSATLSLFPGKASGLRFPVRIDKLSESANRCKW